MIILDLSHPITPEIVKAARANTGMSQREATLHLFGPNSPRTWQNWENGTRPVTTGLFVLFLLLTDQITPGRARAFMREHMAKEAT